MTTPIDRESVDPLHVKHPADGITRRVDEHYDLPRDVEQDPHGAWLAIQSLCAALDAAQEQIAAMEEGLTAVHMAGYMEGKKAADAEIKRLRDGLVELRDDPILHRKTAYMRRRAAVILKEGPDGLG